MDTPGRSRLITEVDVGYCSLRARSRSLHSTKGDFGVRRRGVVERLLSSLFRQRPSDLAYRRFYGISQNVGLRVR